uniref:SH3 domain-containing protein n=1 Tax=Anopheles coluzzii TaxID=1518534 RepID=A0A8W7PXD9_ANOCL
MVLAERTWTLQRVAGQCTSRVEEEEQERTWEGCRTVGATRVYRALYDYEAQDSDEVGFSEGDLIIEVNSIDAGWMTGRVERTGLTGMLPANYVELMKI